MLVESTHIKVDTELLFSDRTFIEQTRRVRCTVSYTWTGSQLTLIDRETHSHLQFPIELTCMCLDKTSDVRKMSMAAFS